MDIAKEIKKIVDEMIDNDKMFTAYDVTRKLRVLFPKINIRHAGIRNNIALMYDNGDMSDYGRTQETVNGVTLNVFHSMVDDSYAYTFEMNDDFINGVNDVTSGDVTDDNSGSALSSSTASTALPDATTANNYLLNSIFNTIFPDSKINIGGVVRSSTKDDGKYLVETTGDNRLNISPRILNKIGAKPFDYIHLFLVKPSTSCLNGISPVSFPPYLIGRLVMASRPVTYVVGLNDTFLCSYKVMIDSRIRISCDNLDLIDSSDNDFFQVSVNDCNEIIIQAEA